MENLLFLCCAYSDTQAKDFLFHSTRGYQYAAQNFQLSLIEGFIQNKELQLSVLSIPSLSTYPCGCKIVKVNDSPFRYGKMMIGYSFGFINIPIINNIYQSRIDKYIDDWYNKSKGGKCIVVYAMLKQQMRYAVEAKKRYADITLCLVIPDLPAYMACNKYYKCLGLQKRDLKLISSMTKYFDSYVLLTEPMKQVLEIGCKPYVVIEGIYSDTDKCSINPKKIKGKTILYAGGIVSRYGVFDLIEAFHRINDDEYKLILCGPCPEMEKLCSYLSSDPRIDYRGMISTDEVRILQKQVSLLVNPRHSNEEFTRYSFPSKTLEYMASGTPVLMSPLPSLPEEYKQYLYLFDDESIDGIRLKIMQVLSQDIDILNEKGKQAQTFVRLLKNSKVQTKKIIDLILSI